MQKRVSRLGAGALLAAFFAAWLLQPSAAHAQVNAAVGGQRVIDGPFYSPRNLRAFKVFGVHLSMPATEAIQALIASGLVPQDAIAPRFVETASEILGNFNVPQSGGWVQLHYTKIGGNDPVISGINYWRKLPTEAGGTIDRLRAELVASYGNPTVWTQQIDEQGVLRDSAAYVPARRFVDAEERKTVRACSLNWICTELRDKVDCRDLLKRAGTPMMEVRFTPQAIVYQMFDYGPVYGALARDAGFRGEEPIEAACPAPPAE
jgi:hypothetical protein